MTSRNLAALAAMALLVFAGCTGTNPDTAFVGLQETVATHSGQTLRWTRQEASRNQTDTRLQSLLQTNLTAQSSVAIALLNNRSLQAEFEELGISQADLAQASRLRNIELAGSWRFPNRPPSATDVEYSAAGNFLDLLTIPARKKIAARNLEETRSRIGGAVLQLAAEAQREFYTLQGQIELAQRLEIIVEANDAAAGLGQRLYDAGDINELELYNHQAPSVQSRLDLMRAQAGAQAERERLNRLLGLSGAQTKWTIAAELPALPATDPPLENLESLAIRQRLDLAALRTQAQTMASALRLKTHLRFVPGAAIGVDTERTPDGQRVTGPTLDLELPIFDQGQPAVARLTAQLEQAKDRYAAFEINVQSEAREAAAVLLAARAAVEFSQKSLLPLRRRILGETLLHYNAMQKNSFDLLLAKEREQNAEQSCVEALRDYWIARVELERAVGGRLSTDTAASADPAQPKP